MNKTGLTFDMRRNRSLITQKSRQLEETLKILYSNNTKKVKKEKDPIKNLKECESFIKKQGHNIDIDTTSVNDFYTVFELAKKEGNESRSK